MNGGFRMWTRQIASVIRLEMSKTFFARRGLWVYLLALAPVGIFSLHAIAGMNRDAYYAGYHDRNPLTREQLDAVQQGMPLEEVEAELGEPMIQFERGRQPFQRATRIYTDGSALFTFTFATPQLLERNAGGPLGDFAKGKGLPPGGFGPGGFGKGKGPGRGSVEQPAGGDAAETNEDAGMTLESINVNEGDSLSRDSLIFATVFQFFFLRLAVFFGCVGVFTNLFRGELLDKSLHFYLLAPLRREVLMVGKYLAGLIATSVIFCTSTALQLMVMGLHQDSAALSNYLSGSGWDHVFAYLGVTLAACVGYGSVFLAAGLLVRNPILPAAAVLIWEGMNIFLPATLKKISIIFYLQSLCPVVAPPDSSVPQVLRLLITSAEPTPAWLAVTGLLVVSTVLLLIAGRRARRLEINYGAE